MASASPLTDSLSLLELARLPAAPLVHMFNGLTNYDGGHARALERLKTMGEGVGGAGVRGQGYAYEPGWTRALDTLIFNWFGGAGTGTGAVEHDQVHLHQHEYDPYAHGYSYAQTGADRRSLGDGVIERDQYYPPEERVYPLTECLLVVGVHGFGNLFCWCFAVPYAVLATIYAKVPFHGSA